MAITITSASGTHRVVTQHRGREGALRTRMDGDVRVTALLDELNAIEGRLIAAREDDRRAALHGAWLLAIVGWGVLKLGLGLSHPIFLLGVLAVASLGLISAVRLGAMDRERDRALSQHAAIALQPSDVA